MKTITFELSEDNPIKYAGKDGNEIEVNFIELEEPTGKVSHLCCEIEALIQSGLVKMAGELDEATIEQAKNTAEQAKESQDNSGPDADSVLAIMSSGGIDMKKVVVNFRELFKSVALMGGEKPLTVPRMDSMAHKDFRMMMGVYASNFILA